MKSYYERFDRFDARVTAWMARHGILLLRISLGIVFLWFGALKFFEGFSPAEDLVVRTIDYLSFGQVPPAAGMFIVATWESLIGIGLLTGVLMRATLALLWLQMIGAVAPLFIFPGITFTVLPVVPTLEGQYIIKNIVLITAGIVIGGTVRGAEPVSR